MTEAVLAPPRPFAFGAAVTGASHVRAGLPCQDAFAMATLEPGQLAIAVADGLGSAARAHEGARAAVEAAVARATAARGEPRGDVALWMAIAGRLALEGFGDAIRDVACTMIAVVADADGVAVEHIGDGAVVARSGDGLRLVSGPAPREYVNEVTPLSDRRWTRELRPARLEDRIEAVAVFTDGCHHAGIGPDGAPSGGFFDPLFAYAAGTDDATAASDAIATLLGGEKIGEHSDDDKTLVLALFA